MIHLLDRPATPQQIQDMLEVYPFQIKIVVDIRRRLLAGGGEMHADCEALLYSQLQRSLLAVQAKQWADQVLRYAMG